MALNSKPIILYDNMFGLAAFAGQLSAIDTDSDNKYDIDNVKDLRTYTFWKGANNNHPKYISIDLNIIENAGLEDAVVSEWTFFGAGSRSNADANTGSWSILHAPAGVNEAGAFSKLYAVDETKDYNLSVYSRVTAYSSGQFQVYIRFFADLAGTNLISANAFVSKSAVDDGFTNDARLYGPNGAIAFPQGTKAINITVYSIEFGNYTAYLDDIVFYPLTDVSALGIVNHNLGTGKVDMDVQWSDSLVQPIATWTGSGDKISPTNDKTTMELLASTVSDKRAYRIKLSALTQTIIPYIGQLILGEHFTFEKYTQAGFNPDGQKIISETNRSIAANILSSTINSFQRDITLNIRNLSPTWVAVNLMPAWENHLRYLKPFLFAWDITNHSSEIYYVKIPDKQALNLPYNPVTRDFTMKMEGILEE